MSWIPIRVRALSGKGTGKIQVGRLLICSLAGGLTVVLLNLNLCRIVVSCLVTGGGVSLGLGGRWEGGFDQISNKVFDAGGGKLQSLAMWQDVYILARECVPCD